MKALLSSEVRAVNQAEPESNIYLIIERISEKGSYLRKSFGVFSTPRDEAKLILCTFLSRAVPEGYKDESQVKRVVNYALRQASDSLCEEERRGLVGNGSGIRKRLIDKFAEGCFNAYNSSFVPARELKVAG